MSHHITSHPQHYLSTLTISSKQAPLASHLQLSHSPSSLNLPLNHPRSTHSPLCTPSHPLFTPPLHHLPRAVCPSTRTIPSLSSPPPLYVSPSPPPPHPLSPSPPPLIPCLFLCQGCLSEHEDVKGRIVDLNGIPPVVKQVMITTHPP